MAEATTGARAEAGVAGRVSSVYENLPDIAIAESVEALDSAESVVYLQQGTSGHHSRVCNLTLRQVTTVVCLLNLYFGGSVTHHD